MSQLLDGINLQEISQDHLKSLILLKVSETPRIEYKQTLNMGRDSDNRELCKDVSALANSLGGYLFFGISESDGNPFDIPGIDIDDSVKQQLYQVLTSGISPRIQTITDTTIPLENGKSVLLIKVEPDGYLHQVKYNDERFYKRTGTITVAMQSADVETFYQDKGATRQDQIREIMRSYYDRLKDRTYFKGVDGEGVMAMVIIPEMASYKLDMSNISSNFNTMFQPLYCEGWSWEVTGRSRFTYANMRDSKVPYAVTEVTELAEIKAYNTYMLQTSSFDQSHLLTGSRGLVPSVAYEQEFIMTMHRYLSSLNELGVSPPYFIHIALLEVYEYFLAVNPMRAFTSSRIYPDRDIMPDLVHISSEQQFNDLQAVAGALKPAFDFIWREFGFDRCLNFNDMGEWTPPSH